LKEQEYKEIITALNQRIDIKTAQFTDSEKKLRKTKLKSLLFGSVIGSVITVIIVLL
jgi:hypothetical protein